MKTLVVGLHPNERHALEIWFKKDVKEKERRY
jgi:hypothetical protein